MILDYVKKNELDQEWVELILAAKKMGLSVEHVRSFIKQKSQHPSLAFQSSPQFRQVK